MINSLFRIFDFSKPKVIDDNIRSYRDRREMLEYVGKNHKIVVEMNRRLDQKVKMQQREIDWLKDQVDELKALMGDK